jgi:prevent-host-death family protein
MTREVPVTQARADLAELVSRVGYSGERILLTRHGKALAALVPVSDLEALERPPAEIGFSIAPPPEPADRPEHRSGPMRIAAEHRDPRPRS